MIRRVIILTDITDVGKTEMALRISDAELNDRVEIHFVKVKKFSIVNTIFLFRLLFDSAIEGDIFLVVMDPRYNSKSRESLYVRTKNNINCFIPNNGIISWVLNDFGIKDSYLIPVNQDNKDFPTFNGKYKYAPAINSFLKDINFVEKLTKFSIKDIVTTNINEGEVVHIDNYGNLKVYFSDKNIYKKENIKVNINDKEVDVKLSYDFNVSEDGTPVFYSGSSLDGLLELALIRDSFAEKFNVEIGDVIKIRE